MPLDREISGGVVRISGYDEDIHICGGRERGVSLGLSEGEYITFGVKGGDDGKS